MKKTKTPISVGVRIFRMIKKIRDPEATDRVYNSRNRQSYIPIWGQEPPLEVRYRVHVPVLSRKEVDRQKLRDAEELFWKWSFCTRNNSQGKSVLTSVMAPVLVTFFDKPPVPEPDNRLIVFAGLLHPVRRPRIPKSLQAPLVMPTVTPIYWQNFSIKKTPKNP